MDEAGRTRSRSTSAWHHHGLSKTTPACAQPAQRRRLPGFCESDFVSSLRLAAALCLQPAVFLNDPPSPRQHGDAGALHRPRKMDGKRLEPARILTTSSRTTAPRQGRHEGRQVCTNLVPDFASKRWWASRAPSWATPSTHLPVADRRQDQRRRRRAGGGDEGFHWMMSYGSYLRECGYALKKMGVDFLNVSKA